MFFLNLSFCALLVNDCYIAVNAHAILESSQNDYIQKDVNLLFLPHIFLYLCIV